MKRKLTKQEAGKMGANVTHKKRYELLKIVDSIKMENKTDRVISKSMEKITKNPLSRIPRQHSSMSESSISRKRK